MQLGMIGLGRMGSNMVRRLMRGGHECVVYDRAAEAVDALAKEGAAPSSSLAELVGRLRAPRAVWLMVPASGVGAVVSDLAPLLERDDTIVDGGNTHYQDDIARSTELAARGLHLVDAGTSGGVWGLERGYCLMVGGETEAVRRLEPLLATLAPGPGHLPRTPGREALGGTAERGYLHCGPTGAGHFVKMVHNGVEYGLMAAYGEGFNLLKQAGRYDFNLADIAEVWRRGSVISSWLLDLTAASFARDPGLDGYDGHVADSGEGRWALAAANEEGVPAFVLAAALFSRFASRGEDDFQNRVLSAMRFAFGGHLEKP